jgi:hypothetical protein
VPEVDPFTQGMEGTAASLSALTEACADDGACSREFDDLGADIDRALARLDGDAAILHVPAEVATNGPADVVVDDVRFLALLRAVISDGGSSGGGFVPGIVPTLVRQELDGGVPG